MKKAFSIFRLLLLMQKMLATQLWLEIDGVCSNGGISILTANGPLRGQSGLPAFMTAWVCCNTGKTAADAHKERRDLLLPGARSSHLVGIHVFATMSSWRV